MSRAMFRPLTLAALLGFLTLAPLPLPAQPASAPTPRPLSWIPQGFEVLGQRAAFHTDFTFDRSMLQLAGYFVGDSDPQVRNAVAKLDGISVHSYHFGAPGLYDPETLNLIRAQFESSGWRHLVTAHAKGDPFNSGQTDLWVNVNHMDVTGMMLLVSGSKDLNLIALNGDISTVDLLHLRGHFGIPRFSGDGFVPGRAPHGRQPYVPPTTEATPNQDPGQYSGGGVGVGTPDGLEPAPPPPTPPGF